MATRLSDPFPQFWSSSAAYSGGTLYFYQTASATPLAVYSDETLQTSIGTSISLNSAGRFDTDVFLQNTAYKIVLKDSDGVTVWTADPVRPSDFLSFPKWSVGSGNPNGVVAGTASSAGVMPDKYWDFSNNIEYTCTTTGTSSTAVWAALNASASTPSVPPPQGRLTPTSGTPVISADVISGTAVYYSPYLGNLIPIYNGSSMIPTEFSELTLTLASQHAVNQIYDVFVFSNSGVLTVVTGPAWTTATAGSGARGSGAGTTQLSRVKGLWTNTVSMTGRNGATTYTIGANLATYVGSIFIDGTAAQVSCHVTYGQNRKHGVWNAYNREPITLQTGDGTASWNYTTATIRASNNVPATWASASYNVGSGTTCNGVIAFCGLPDEGVAVENTQAADGGSTGVFAKIGIGVNSVTANSGTSGGFFTSPAGPVHNMHGPAKYTQVPFIGLNTYTPTEFSTASGTTTWYGSSADMLLTAKWLG